METYGFDGLDIDLEQLAITAGDNQTVIPATLKIVKDHYRDKEKISSLRWHQNSLFKPGALMKHTLLPKWLL